MNGIETSRPSSSSSGSKASRESSITVAVRVRPFTAIEENNLVRTENDPFFLGDGSFSSNQDTPSKRSILTPRGIRKIIDVVDDKMLIFDPPETNPLARMQKNAFPNGLKGSRIREHRFVFDKLFDVDATQDDVYRSTARPLLDSVLDGFNATVFAYGATGCGKTHTISGSPDKPGVIFLTMKELYDKIESLSDTKHIDVSLSFLEIYNETIRDLMNPETDFKKLVLREDSNNKISVSNLSSHKPANVEEVMDMILKGNQNRTSSPTEANATSSRSHAVLQINVVQKNRTADIKEEHTFATLSIIDLAGSERAAATKNRGIRLNEGANINKSLLALGNCINALCDPRRRNHVPYRDSKLTRLLKFSLGGNCKTVMIVCVSPSSQHYDETLNTLKYADRAKEIKTKLIRNSHNLDRHVGSYLKMITEQKQEIEELRLRENKIVEQTLEKQRVLNDKCLHILLESIDNVKQSLNNQSQEKWKKYFILAKRKLLLLQRIETEIVLGGVYKVMKHKEDVTILNTMANLCEQLISKIDSQIPELESQYSRPNDIDYIFNESAEQVLKKLKENEGWTDYNTLIFEKEIGSLKESLERDILFNSSILFDHLVHELKDFYYVARNFSNSVSVHLRMGKENIDDDAEIEKLVEGTITSLEMLLNGEYDSAVEQFTSAFMQRKIIELEMARSLQPPLTQDNNAISQPTNSKSIPKPRESKRGPLSPLKSSPSRQFKRSIAKKPITPKFSPQRAKNTKKVRWDIPRSDTTFDTSVDEYTFQNTTLKSDPEDSPLGNTILDRSILGDDLELAFDPNLESPPVPIASDINSKLLEDISKSRGKKADSFSNRRLSINLSASPTTTASTKLPLLNKQASIKLASANTHPSLIPASPNKLGMAMSPTSVISQFNMLENGDSARNIESNGSEKVD
ncbi:P-loop containing nucleoside triphosphate hydrolase protein [Scheffersomyces xylosifermentans]|uniref:P-loop containing nucleoside triphosphate hydrolase protein n=1 Tax=Scheffersomyces xylosifermentans TaxID=1304137 RepID=UPI00315D1586